MELKLDCYVDNGDIWDAFNRTFMELKRTMPSFSVCYRTAFNRTFMELKLNKDKTLHTYSVSLLIAPLWN